MTLVTLPLSSLKIGRIVASRDQMHATRDRLRARFEGGLQGEARFEWSLWPFGHAAMAFGLVFMVIAAGPLRMGLHPYSEPSSHRAAP